MKTKHELTFIVFMVLTTILVIYFHAPLIVYGYALILFILLCLTDTFKQYQNIEQEATEQSTNNNKEETTDNNRSGIIAFCCVVFFIATIIYLYVAK
jgi:Ca2+/Na+ antiporter